MEHMWKALLALCGIAVVVFVLAVLFDISQNGRYQATIIRGADVAVIDTRTGKVYPREMRKDAQGNWIVSAMDRH